MAVQLAASRDVTFNKIKLNSLGAKGEWSIRAEMKNIEGDGYSDYSAETLE